ncbi:MAG: tetratricopeptide repeat protein, partial [Bacteroidota bacterium]
MMGKIFILLSIVSFQAIELMAQCPPIDSIRGNIFQYTASADFENSKSPDLLLRFRDKLLQCGYQRDSVYNVLLKRITVWYKRHGNFSEAARFLEQSIAITKLNTKESLVNNDLIKGYYWLSVFYDSLNHIAAKIKAIDSCLAISNRMNYPYDGSSLRCLLLRLQYFYDIGEYKLCINDAEACEKKAVEYSKTVSDPISKNAGKDIAQSSFHWHINALLRLKEFLEAEKLLSTKTAEYKKNGDKNYLALTYAQFAEVYEEKGDYQQSLVYFNLALKIYRENKNAFNSKQTLRNIGEAIFFTHFKDYDKALFYFKDALTCINHEDVWNKEDSVESLSLFGNIANVYVQKKLFDS